MKRRLVFFTFVTFFLTILVGGITCSDSPTTESHIVEGEIYNINGNQIITDYQETEDLFLEELSGNPIVYDSKDLTSDILENRNGSLIVERCVGISDENLDGFVLNSADDSYISYKGIPGIKDGTVLVSYLVYNTETSYVDDISERYDFVISREEES